MTRTGEAQDRRLDASERDLVLLALAILSLDRPGMMEACAGIADKIGSPDGRRGAGSAMYAEFRRLNADRWRATPPRPLL